jgi:hypothetical protein
MNNATLNHDTNVEFRFNNSFIDATDVIIVNVKSAIGSSSEYIASVHEINNGYCNILLRNISNDNGNKSDAVQLQFAIIKAVNS